MGYSVHNITKSQRYGRWRSTLHVKCPHCPASKAMKRFSDLHKAEEHARYHVRKKGEPITKRAKHGEDIRLALVKARTNQHPVVSREEIECFCTKLGVAEPCESAATAADIEMFVNSL